MKTDVLAWATGQQPSKMISKETLNHPGLIGLVSGLDVYHHTREAYLRAYQALGIDTVKLTTGSSDDVRQMVFDFAERTQGVSGSVISSCGGLHGNIPLSNLEAYFDARAEIGVTPRDWRTCCHA